MLGYERRVVITGLGLVTPLGDSPDRVWASLAEGRGMVRTLEAFRVAGISNDVGAEIRNFDLKNSALPKYWNALRKDEEVPGSGHPTRRHRRATWGGRCGSGRRRR